MKTNTLKNNCDHYLHSVRPALINMNQAKINRDAVDFEIDAYGVWVKQGHTWRFEEQKRVVRELPYKHERVVDGEVQYSLDSINWTN